MDRALWLLLRLRLWGWLRRLGRSMASVRGALLVLVGLMVFVPGVVASLLGSQEPSPLARVWIQRYGPPALALYCLLGLLSAGEGALAFSPAEVNFLFCGPLNRKQLLGYKILAGCGLSLLSASFMSLFFGQHAGSYLAALVALTLALGFLQLVPMLMSLLVSSIGARAYSRQRRIALLLIAVVAVAGLVYAGAGGMDRGFPAFVDELENSAAGRVVLAPFGWFIQTFLARDVWPDLARWAGLSLLVNLALVGLILALDAHYLETSAAFSERVYARLQRLRRGVPMAPAGGRARWGMPQLPAWGGVGTLAWRQLTAALRSPWSLLATQLIFILIVLPLLLAQGAPGPDGLHRVPLAAAVLVGLALFISPMLPFDFRGDIDRVEILKTLPVPGWRIAAGQLLAPVLLLTAVQWLTFGAALAVLGRAEPLLLAAAAFGPPLNCVLFAVDNLLFLWFPTRMMAATPGDLQMMGRQMLLWIVKLITLEIIVGVAALLGVLAYFILGESVAAALAVGWLALAAGGIALVPLVAVAFRYFDVARDTPP